VPRAIPALRVRDQGIAPPSRTIVDARMRRVISSRAIGTACTRWRGANYCGEVVAVQIGGPTCRPTFIRAIFAELPRGLNGQVVVGADAGPNCRRTGTVGQR
jgi:hypothetical protein